MKKNVAVAMAITAGLCFAGSGHVKPAFAGHWEEIGISSRPWEPQFSSQYADRYQGEFTQATENIDSSGTTHSSDDNYTWKEAVENFPHIRPNGFFEYSGDAFGGSNGGSSSVSSTGKRRSLFRWIPDFTGEAPPDTLKLKITAFAVAEAGSDGSEQHRDVTKEHVVVSAAGESGQTVANHQSGFWGYHVSHQDVTTTKLVQVATNGQTDVWGPWIDFSATASLDGDRVVQEQNESPLYLHGDVALNFDYRAAVDDRSVSITSPTIDDSYQYVTDEVLPLLGSPLEFRSGTPEPPASGPYSVKHRRESDNSIYTDSLAQWIGLADGVAVPSWYGGGEFKANTPNFHIGKHIEWSVEGGNLTDEAQAVLDNDFDTINITPRVIGANPPNAPIPFGIDLGGDIDGNGMTTLSKITLKVTDDTPIIGDGAVGMNTYNIRWHRPYENWTITDSHAAPTIIIWAGKKKASSTVQLDYDYDFQQVGFDFGTALGKGAAYLGVASPVVVYTVAAPAAPYVATLAGLMQVASLIIEPNPPVVSQHVDNTELTYAKYKDAVNHAANNELYSNGQKYYNIGINPQDDPDGTARATMFMDVISDFQSNTNGDGDSYYEHDTQVEAQVVMNPLTHDWSSDTFDVHGYAGKFYGSTTNTDGVPTIQPTWFYEPGTPNP